MRILGLVLASLPLVSCQSAEAMASNACVEKLRESLVAPSTLEIVWSGHMDAGPITKKDVLQRARDQVAEDDARFDELTPADRIYLAQTKKWLKEDPAQLLQFFDPGSAQQSFLVLLEYDAENRMGAPLRSFYACRVVPAKSTEKPWVFSNGIAPAAEAKTLKPMMKS